MPWRSLSIMDERAQFVFEAAHTQFSFAELCRRNGISRPTGYKWLRRHQHDGLSGFVDRSHRPHSCPHAVPPQIVERILELRRHRRWGAPKLQRLVADEFGSAPAVSSIHRILVRHGLVQKRKPRRQLGKAPASPLQADRPNALWTVDFKGQFKTRDGQLCYPLTVQDAYSRFLLDCRALSAPATEPTIHCFRRIFRTYGMPERIRTDNGQPFASPVSLGRISTLSVWWIQIGIIPELIQPGKPQQNGRHERMHRTLKREATRPARASLPAQQRAFNEFRTVFNQQRPHQALDQRTPASLYEPSPIVFVEPPPPITYPEHFEVRYVSQHGNIRWKSRFIWVSRVLANLDVGLERVSDAFWAVYYGPRRLGWLDEDNHRIVHIRMNGRANYPVSRL